MKVYSTLLSIIITYYVIVIFLLSSTGYARNLGEERELDDPTPTENDENGSGSPSGGGGDTNKGFGFIKFTVTGGGIYYVKDEGAVFIGASNAFKNFKVEIKGSGPVEYTLTPKYTCDGNGNGVDCKDKTEGECKPIEFTIKRNNDKLEFDESTKPTGAGEISEVADGDSDATTAYNTYISKTECTKGSDNNLPSNVQIKFTITGKGDVYVKGTNAVRILNNEYTYYEVTNNNKNGNSELTFTPNNQCGGSDLPQLYYACQGQTCEGISVVQIKYDASASTKVTFAVTAPDGYSGLAIDSASTVTVTEYSEKTKCKVAVVPDGKDIKFTGTDEVIIITKDNEILEYEKSNSKKYSYLNTDKGDGSLGGSKYSSKTGSYKCGDEGYSEFEPGSNFEANYYKEDETKEHFRIVLPSSYFGYQYSPATDDDLKLVTEREDQSFCKSSGGDDGNSYPQPLGDKVVKTFPKDDNVYRVLEKDRHYIVKESTYQYSTKLTRNTEGNNNFTTITVTDEDLNSENIYKTETGYYKDYFTNEIQTEFGCTAPKSFASIAWCEKNCNNATGVLNSLKNRIEELEINYFEEVSLNLTVKNGTDMVYLYESESKPFVNHIGNITESFSAEMEDIGFSVIPTILFSLILIFLL